VRFVHPWNYFRALEVAVAVLDTYPYGGCLSTLDALAFAVPVVTLPSHLIRGR
jgi:predicted O-linked N-acetylglucosamine transferase (SPINDLY family)